MIVTLKDGSKKEYNEGKSVLDIAADISEGLARVALAGEVDGQVVDLRKVIDKDCQLNILTSKDPEGLATIRHTASHILAQAVKNLYPHAKLAIGPSTSEGFYYDFEAEPFSREDLDNIEAEMKRIIKEGHEITKFTLPREEAIAFMQEKNEPFKVELIEDLPEGEEISFYDQGGFIDLCAGPHLKTTKGVKAFKLISSSMAYWRGDEHKARLQRIYGTAFDKKEDLKEHLAKLEDAKNRDHNKLGRELGVFMTVDVIGQGLPLFTSKGNRIIQRLTRWIEDLEDYEWGYERTRTPLMAKSDLYKISGHWDHYKDGMFVLGNEEKDKEVLALRPMTCPFQFNVYNRTQHSYKDMPVRLAETSTLFRHEESGEMHGLTRVRQFTITEGHVMIRPDQTEAELERCIELCRYVMETLGVADEVTYRLSKWDPNNKEKYQGGEEYWEMSQEALRKVLHAKGIPFTEAEGEAAFYGPKIDIQAKNVYGKEDTVVTVQMDCMNAHNFDMTYIDEEGKKQRPYIIHRTSLGCYERTLAWLIEKYAGNLPTWLCPEQVRVLPISDKYIDYAKQVEKALTKKRVWASVDTRSEKIGYKIREARLERIPYLLIVGEKEEKNGEVSVRSRYKGEEGAMPLDKFVEDLVKEIDTKEIRKIEVKEEN